MFPRRRLPFRSVVAGSALLLALAGAAIAGVVAHAGTSGTTTVTVTEREYHLTLSKTALNPGAYKFVAVNKGKVAHSLEIDGPGLDRRISGTVAPGGSKTLSVTLRNGTYQIFCPVDGHKGLGMNLKVKVGSGGASSSSTTTTSGGGGGWG